MLALVALLLWPNPATASYFNCSVIYDEFESLMNKQFLTEPDRFVSTVNQRITRKEFETLQKGQFLMYEERHDMGIAVFTTNENLSGRLLFRWSDPLVDGQSHLIIEQAVIFSSAAAGYGPQHSGPFRIKPGHALDLDTGQYESSIGNPEQPDAGPVVGDLRHSIDPETGEAVFEAINEAVVHFPVESMCSEASK